jgi:hypothetical protein
LTTLPSAAVLTRSELARWLVRFAGRPHTPALRLEIEDGLREVLPAHLTVAVLPAKAHDGLEVVIGGGREVEVFGVPAGPVFLGKPIPPSLPDPTRGELRASVEQATREVERLG